MKNLSKIFMVLGVAFVAVAMTAALAVAADYCLEDSYEYVWKLDVVDNTADAIYLSGTQDPGANEASAIYNKRTGTVTLASNYGTCFHYSLDWTGSAGSGPWINTLGSGHGMVDVRLCGESSFAVPNDGPCPGE
ncbi:MAG: hypothetical protein HF982_01625 [Desulfobacteraceae bacterium]|nr:hypothetical protein [Desulfobacteraceae bacterium]MBC2718294.1 hypothetical protein [Desulfobacteraceae bacterium]